MNTSPYSDSKDMTEISDTPNTPSAYSLVRIFHETYGQVIRDIPELEIPERVLRIELIIEEAEELATANKEDDIIEVADALADLLYVTYGAAIAHGFHPDEELIPNQSPAATVRSELERLGLELPESPTLDISLRSKVVNEIVQYAKKYRTASESGDLGQLQKAIVSLIVKTYGASFLFGIDVDAVLEEVQRSNMSKLGEDGKPVYREDGKVLKGPGFFVPDVAKVLTAQGWKA
jgi:predicted HAD superfamily Cof-like phosphohydrolase